MAQTNPHRIGDRIITTGAGRTWKWHERRGPLVGTVVGLLPLGVIVAWDDSAVEDEMGLNEVAAVTR